jgi:choline kinase
MATISLIALLVGVAMLMLSVRNYSAKLAALQREYRSRVDSLFYVRSDLAFSERQCERHIKTIDEQNATIAEQRETIAKHAEEIMRLRCHANKIVELDKRLSDITGYLKTTLQPFRDQA